MMIFSQHKLAHATVWTKVIFDRAKHISIPFMEIYMACILRYGCKQNHGAIYKATISKFSPRLTSTLKQHVFYAL